MFTVGYGDIAPRDSFERICSILAIIVGCLFYSFIIGNVTAQIYYVENNEAQYQNKMQDIQAFLEARKVLHVYLNKRSGEGDQTKKIQLINQCVVITKLSVHVIQNSIPDIHGNGTPIVRTIRPCSTSELILACGKNWRCETEEWSKALDPPIDIGEFDV